MLKATVHNQPRGSAVAAVPAVVARRRDRRHCYGATHPFQCCRQGTSAVSQQGPVGEVTNFA